MIDWLTSFFMPCLCHYILMRWSVKIVGFSERNLHSVAIFWKSMGIQDSKAKFAKQMFGETARIGIIFLMYHKISVL